MELLVQNYFRGGKTLTDLKEEHSIKCNAGEGLVILNYDQIKSAKTDPIVMECRGLILEMETWNVVAMAFRRFFNYGEALDITEDFNFKRSHVCEKIDGSILNVFFYNGRWMMSTRGTIEGTGDVGFFNMTFKQLFDRIIANKYPNFYEGLDESLCYIFELVSPESKVVKPYPRGLYLLGARDKTNNFNELTYEDLIVTALKCGVQIPEKYPLNDIQDLLDCMRSFSNVDEGFVCVDYTERDEHNQFRRIKVKNPSYVALSHLKESSASSMRALVQLVMNGEVDEFVGYFPEFKKTVTKIKDLYDGYVAKVNDEAKDERVVNLIKNKGAGENRKEYALLVCRMSNPNFMFQLYEGSVSSFSDYLISSISKKGAKNMAKSMMDILKVQDIEFNKEQ